MSAPPLTDVRPFYGIAVYGQQVKSIYKGGPVPNLTPPVFYDPLLRTYYTPSSRRK